ncbi:MAG: DUF2298 domain-containing protein [Anaerolineae bacterium]|nr:DUF2298 domain-containing protein [Thermoflexales bacterium]MDW8407279.1 DUF2298 domain-containing protein [Anaerolineae bacterium]
MLDLLVWYVWLQVFSLGGWVIAARWLRALPDRGYGISKALGLLLGGFAYWWIVLAGLSANHVGAPLMALCVLFVAGVALWRVCAPGCNEPLLSLPPRLVLIVTEVLFAGALALWAVYRAYNPEILEAGGEKFMEIMMLNAILRSPTFPPNDAWLAGFSISYYYFGYVILAMLTRLSGLPPTVAFNLGNATFFALTVIGAFSLGWNLFIAQGAPRGAQRSAPPLHPSASPARAGLAAGLLTAVLLAVMGNQGGLMESIRCAKVLPSGFWDWLDVRQIAAQPVDCNGLAPTRYYWWWDWSRVVHDYTPDGRDQEVITESPVFSFLLGDNHPHVMGLPFTLIAVALAFNFYRAFSPLVLSRSRASVFSLCLLALSAVVVGGLAFMNTWDLPVYGALVAGGLVMGRLARRETIWPALLFATATGVLGYTLYAPFYATFDSQASGVGLNLFNGTRWPQFFLMFAPFIVIGAAFVGASVRRVSRATQIPGSVLAARAVSLAALAILGVLAGLVLITLLSPYFRDLFAQVMQGGSVFGVNRELALQRIVARLLDPWTPVYLLLFAALCVTLILASLWAPDRAPEPAPDLFVLVLFLGGALLTVAVEFVFVRDMFGTRMNTVFKFYYQAWTVWAIAGGYALIQLFSARNAWPRLAGSLAGLLITAGLLYPVFTAYSRTDAFTRKPTLDGAAYLKTSRPDDAAAINWLNANVTGAPVIAEAPADRYGAYSYNGRISAFTGLPTLLGWGGHQHQWRGNYEEPARREPLIEALFNRVDDRAARAVIDEFNVRYVIVGAPERARYSAEGLAKFEQLGRPVFRSGSVVIYRVFPSSSLGQ